MGKRVTVQEMEQLVNVVLRERIEGFTISRKFIKRLVKERFGDDVVVTGQGVARAVRLVKEKGILIPTQAGPKTNLIFAVDVHKVLNGVEEQ